MKVKPTAIAFALCICFAIGHNVISGKFEKTALRNSSDVFVDCCLGRKLLCKSPTVHWVPWVPWVRNRPTPPKLLTPSQVCDGKTDCPQGEDEICIKCKDPPQVQSGYRVDNSSFFPVGAVVTYACNLGFGIRDVDTVTCDHRGMWSRAPVCDRLCDVLPSVGNGSVSAGEPLTPGDTIIVSCNDGFLPMRNNFLTCAANGSWTGTPACVRLCPSPPPAILNAKPSAVLFPFIVDTVVPYRCDGGYVPDPSSRMVYTCDANGNWVGNVTCVPATATGHVIICDPTTFSISCPAPLRIEVKSANFGRTSADIECYGVAKSEHCFISVLSTLTVQCNGKSICRIEAPGDDYPSDPCPPSTDKYLEMQFICK